MKENPDFAEAFAWAVWAERDDATHVEGMFETDRSRYCQGICLIPGIELPFERDVRYNCD
jgi:hypothetical protein